MSFLGPADTPVADDRRRERLLLSNLVFRAARLAGQRFGPGPLPFAAWTMLLELYVMDARRPLSIKALCLLSGAPMRTALRMIDGLCARRLMVRKRDPRDRRQVNIALSAIAVRHLNAYFDELAGIVAPEGPESIG